MFLTFWEWIQEVHLEDGVADTVVWNWCPLCDQGEETISHLLLGCVLSRQVWSRLLTLWGHGVWCPDADSNLRGWWTSLPLPRRVRRDFLSAIQLVFWTIWRHRNDVQRRDPFGARGHFDYHE
ncbi:hypothetical protein BRADI_1g19042v3 [Brachypodium distachyon]|uniref:Reverse transcriptase zinc-binding domain-containing protein n=1 Tax=Brachypodium distachyon TaxID=15368 RepID=A0A2K2DK29_BRADI|nr:hypothetical protein BRADI_1g19042v3 [Brachypodium distachyon]